jgi:hypothetical protein
MVMTNEKWKFPGAERFTSRHKKIAELYDNMSVADLDVLLCVARQLARDHASPFDHLEPFEHQAPTTITDTKVEPKKRSTPGIPFPEDDQSINSLKKATLKSTEFLQWCTKKGEAWDVDKEWERFAHHAVMNKRRFIGRDLSKSTRMAFMAWLSQPYQHHMMSDAQRRQKASEGDSELSNKVKRAKELRREALKVAKNSTHQYMMIYRGLLKNENIDYDEIKDLL